MSPISEAFQISIISIAIVFTSLLIFSFLIQMMGNYFQRLAKSPVQSVSKKTESSIEKQKIAAIMTVFQEEFKDQLAEIKISRADGREKRT